ncbi:MAG: preprotein translocase subunit SecG [Gammaproteobacteria bacterium]|nr:preprotein translocase subunit SecG [Gammaproteobacteria bacterium]MBQ0840008.1 preprotein translocase subunit SecG [Gammaproteobacteria bacterium]
MEKVILVVHLLTAFAIIGMILLQQGKGADAGASFGSGASQTLFGSAGTWNFFSKTTAILATLFFATSFGLAVIAKNSAGIDEQVLPAIELLEAQVPFVEDDNAIPVLESQSAEVEVLDLPVLEEPSSDLVLPAEPAAE